MKRLLLLLALSGPAGFQQALLILTGASCVEELSEDEMQRFQSLAAHPVDLNLAGRSRLLGTGLLTPYQVASLMDYRSRSGDILSWTELSLVDGFNEVLVSALQEFAVLGQSEAPPGQRQDSRFRQSLVLRGALRASGEAAGGIKYEALWGERAALYVSARNTLTEPVPALPTFSAAWYGRRMLGQVILGHFQARFGQGLVQWSGFQLSGYGTLGAFRKNGTGFSPTGSFSPELFGIAADWCREHENTTGVYAIVGFQVDNTLSESGGVSRGICHYNAEGRLTGVVEHHNVMFEPDGVLRGDNSVTSERVALQPRDLCSMNMWCFTPDYFAASASIFESFLEANVNELKTEFYIPFAIDNMIKAGTAVCDVLSSPSRWFGVTFKEDRPGVVAKLASLVHEGVYPTPLYK